MSNSFPMSLAVWSKANPIDDKMLFKRAAENQFTFVSLALGDLVQVGLLAWAKDFVQVIATHHSKSIELPVYQMARPDLGLTFTLRGNFYDWKLSVESTVPVSLVLHGLCSRDSLVTPIAGCYFEGFPADRIFGSFTEDPSKFSVEIQDNYGLYTAIFLILRARGAFSQQE